MGYQVVYPRDFASRRYDLEATLSRDAPAGQRQQMFQNLLAERLRLLAHEESRELTAYAITVANQGIRMPRAELEPNMHPYDFPVRATITDVRNTFSERYPCRTCLLRYRLTSTFRSSTSPGSEMSIRSICGIQRCRPRLSGGPEPG